MDEGDPTPRITKPVIKFDGVDATNFDQAASLKDLFAPTIDEDGVGGKLRSQQNDGQRSHETNDLENDQGFVNAGGRKEGLTTMASRTTTANPMEDLFRVGQKQTLRKEGVPTMTMSTTTTNPMDDLFRVGQKQTLRKDGVPTVKTTTTNIDPMDDLFRIEQKETDPLIGSSRMPISYIPTFGKEPSQKAFLPMIDEFSSGFGKLRRTLQSTSKEILSQCRDPYNLFGSVVFLFYHIVFCLTIGSSLTRLNGSAALLGLFAKMAASGIIFASPMYWLFIGDIPAMYPTVDLFAAPFLANIAINIDATLSRDPAVQELAAEENDLFFLGSFCVMASFSILLTGAIVVLASVFKLANIGSFLPFPVLAGFFAAVSVLQWQLAFNLDVGMTVGKVLGSGSSSLLVKSLVHHLPSVLSGVLMKVLGPKHPFYVVGIILTSILCFYIIMAIFGLSKEQATEEGWFWGSEDLVYGPLDAPLGFTQWVPPAPFGWINCILNLNYIHWEAAWSGIQPAVALSCLYLIRINLHCPALRKNIPNLSRPESEPSSVNANIGKTLRMNNQKTGTNVNERKLDTSILGMLAPPMAPSSRGRTYSDASEYSSAVEFNELDFSSLMVSAKPTNRSLKEMMATYGYTLWLCALVGGFPVVPTISTQATMYKVRAEKTLAQVGACIFLLGFYIYDFRIVATIPKIAFSSLLVLACLDLISNFVIKSYERTKEKWEWLCVPLIVVISFFVGLLGAVFLGIALSTFFFVGSFFRSGVVKFISSGATIHSTIERGPQSSLWLDEHGSSIQLLVLQNYLFFGNASSILNYIGTMFEDPEDETEMGALSPSPKVVLLDLTLVTGMDTSAVDIFSEILQMCKGHGCKLFLAGVSQSLRQSMHLGGFRPDKPANPSARQLRFFPSLDVAIGKAEDLLLDEAHMNEQNAGKTGSRFLSALQQIDQHHGLTCSSDLAGLEPFVHQILVEPRQVLYEDLIVERGLFFVSSGFLRCQQDAQSTMTRTGGFTRDEHSLPQSLNALNARMVDAASKGFDTGRSFRLARIGPGSIIGGGETLTGSANPGQHVAVSHCVLYYISFSELSDLEESQPRLSLKLHKVLSHMMAKRQSTTINQLATLHSIMSSPAQKRPLRRRGRYT